jgi:hypothetical protein
LIRKSRFRLLAVGVALISSIAASSYMPYFWPAAVILLLAGLYMVAWATLGKGTWCRNCKTFRV